MKKIVFIYENPRDRYEILSPKEMAEKTPATTIITILGEDINEIGAGIIEYFIGETTEEAKKEAMEWAKNNNIIIS